MPLTLAQYRTRVLELLDDPTSTRYTSAQLDTALREALLEYSQARPIRRSYMLDTTGQQILSLPADFSADLITRVQLYNTNPASMPDLPFNAGKIDEQWMIETLGTIYATGQVLVVTYATRHTIDALDSAAGTTITDDELLAKGAAGFAAQSRAISRAESINMQPAVQTQLLNMANQYLAQFRNGLRASQFSTSFAPLKMPGE
jgi:hypothetical protein